MRQIALASLLILAVVGCNGSTDGVTSVPGHAAVAIQVVPNPIVATRVSGDTYDFPFEVVVRETGGRAIDVRSVSINVTGPFGLALHNETWDAARIRSMGYETGVRGNGELRYRFAPRKEVPDDRLFSSVGAELRVDAVDDTGTPTSATTSVTVRRQ